MTSQLRKIAEERLLAEAVRDWRAGRAYHSNSGTYKIRPIVEVAGVPTIGNGSGKTAPWNKIVKKVWGNSSDGLHDAGQATYGGREAPTEFEKMHAMDRVRVRLIEEIAEGKPPAPIQLALSFRPQLPPGTRKG